MKNVTTRVLRVKLRVQTKYLLPLHFYYHTYSAPKIPRMASVIVCYRVH